MKFFSSRKKPDIFTFKSTRDLFFMIIQQASGDDLYIF